MQIQDVLEIWDPYLQEDIMDWLVLACSNTVYIVKRCMVWNAYDS